MTFSLNSTVTWESQSAGSIKAKTGIIVAVVPADTFVRKGQYPGLGIPGISRNHESYIVKVGSKHYWPRVKHLKATE